MLLTTASFVIGEEGGGGAKHSAEEASLEYKCRDLHTFRHTSSLFDQLLLFCDVVRNPSAQVAFVFKC